MKIPSITMELNQEMLTAAITEYIRSHLFGRPVSVDSIEFTAGRKGNGHSAAIEVTFGENTPPKGPVKRDSVGTTGSITTPPQEPVVEEAPDSGDADIALSESDDEALKEESNEEAPTAKKQKRLFVADS